MGISKRYLVLLLVLVALFISANMALARWSFDIGDGYSVERIFLNGLVGGDDEDDGIFGSESFVQRKTGYQKLALTGPVSNGPGKEDITKLRDYYLIKFGIKNWKDPFHPSPPIRPGVDSIAGYKVEDCREDIGPDWLFDTVSCRYSDDTPAPSLYRICAGNAPGVGSSKPLSKTIFFPADVDVFDAMVSMYITDIDDDVSVALHHPDSDYPGDASVQLIAEQNMGGSIGNTDDPIADNTKLDSYMPGYLLDDGGGSDENKPDQPLAKFNGRSAAGEWTLNVTKGNIEFWCLGLLAYRTVRFAEPVYTVQENGGSTGVRIELSEAAATDRTFVITTVPKAGSDQRPFTKDDIIIPKGNLVSETILVPISDDNYRDGNEDLAVQVKPKDTDRQIGLSARSFATIKIIDDDVDDPPPPPPSNGSHYAFLPFINRMGYGMSSTTPAQAPASLASASTWQDLAGSASGGGLSNAPQNGAHTYTAVGSDSYGRPFVAWSQMADGDYEIYLKHWDGKKWRELKNSAGGGGISDNSGDSRRPAIAFDENDNIYVAWEDNSSGKYQIYVKRWYRAGLRWEDLGNTNGPGASGAGFKATFPALTICCYDHDTDIYNESYSGDGPYIAYRSAEYQGQPGEIFVKRYDWGTETWVEVAGSASSGGISKTPNGNSTNPDIRAMTIGSNAHIFVSYGDDAFGDGPATDSENIYLKKVLPGMSEARWEGVGASASSGGISKSPKDSDISTLAVGRYLSDGGEEEKFVLFAAWREKNSSDNGEIYLKKFDEGVGSWTQLGGSASGGGLSNTPGVDSLLPSMDMGDDNLPHIAWEERFDGNHEIFASHWNGSKWREHGPKPDSEAALNGNVSKSKGDSKGPWLAYGPHGVPYVGWLDASSGQYETYLKWYQWWDWE